MAHRHVPTYARVRAPRALVRASYAYTIHSIPLYIHYTSGPQAETHKYLIIKNKVKILFSYTGLRTTYIREIPFMQI